jgi:acetyl-CoA carboxylase biotin carboxylase subunit
VHKALLANPEFAAGGADTAFFERFLKARRPDAVAVS